MSVPIILSTTTCCFSSRTVCPLCCIPSPSFHLDIIHHSRFYDAGSERLRRELAGCSADNESSIGDVAEAHGTNWHPQRLGNIGAAAPCHYHNCTYFWRPQQLRDSNDGEPSNPANWPRLLITNWVLHCVSQALVECAADEMGQRLEGFRGAAWLMS